MRDSSIKVLERKLRYTQAALVFLAVLVIAGLGRDWQVSALAASPRPAGVLHVRGIVIEDDAGRPRMLLGAPTPQVAGRKRPEQLNGIVLLGENGADRIVISYPGYEPQQQGKVVQRSVKAPSAGFMINDAQGNERAGLGVSDDGQRIALGLDYNDRDAIGLLVSPNFSGLAVFARDGEPNDQVIASVGKDGTATFKLADSNGDENIMMEARRDSGLKVQVIDPKTHKLQDVSGRFVP